MPSGVRPGRAGVRRCGMSDRGPRRGGAHRGSHQLARAGARGHRRQPVVRHAGQPPRPVAGARRFVQRVGGGGGDRRGGRRLRQRHRGIGAHPRRLLWNHRAQDHVGPVPLGGVRPLAPSFDTVGPDGPRRGRSRDRDGAARARVQPCRRSRTDGLVVGRLPVEADPSIAAALDRALHLVGWGCRPLPLPEWGDATRAGRRAARRRGLAHERLVGRRGPRRDRVRRAGPAGPRIGGRPRRPRCARPSGAAALVGLRSPTPSPWSTSWSPRRSPSSRPLRGRRGPAGGSLHPARQPGRGSRGHLAPPRPRAGSRPASS